MDTSQKSLKGQLILDNGKLRGSFFHRTVILICQHDSEGAFGVVLADQNHRAMKKRPPKFAVIENELSFERFLRGIHRNLSIMRKTCRGSNLV